MARDDEDDGWGTSSIMKCLIYGQSGSGKTTLASTFPDPIRWLICSGGNRPGELKSIDTAENRKRIKPKVVERVADLPDLIEGSREFATVVLDHASGLADLVLKEILGLEKLPEQKGWGMATQQQYGQQSLQCKEILRSLLNLPANVVILAQERTFGGKVDGGRVEAIAPTVGAALTPSLVGWLNPAVDYVVNTFKKPKFSKQARPGPGGGTMLKREKGVDYCLRVGPHDTYMTKFRMPVVAGRVLPEYITLNPPEEGYSKIVALIEGA